MLILLQYWGESFPKLHRPGGTMASACVKVWRVSPDYAAVQVILFLQPRATAVHNATQAAGAKSCPEE